MNTARRSVQVVAQLSSYLPDGGFGARLIACPGAVKREYHSRSTTPRLTCVTGYRSPTDGGPFLDHIVLTDSYGLLPVFMADLNRMVAKALNCKYGRWENLWAPGSYDRKDCITTDDSLDRMVYTMANATLHGLVEKVEQWPGLKTLPEDFDGRELRATRPGFYLDPKGNMPEEVTLTLEPPPGCEDWDRQDFIQYLPGVSESPSLPDRSLGV